MATFSVIIHCNSAAFDAPGDSPSGAERVTARRKETARILRDIADQIDAHPLDNHGAARDANGNRVATWRALGEDDDHEHEED